MFALYAVSLRFVSIRTESEVVKATEMTGDLEEKAEKSTEKNRKKSKGKKGKEEKLGEAKKSKEKEK